MKFLEPLFAAGVAARNALYDRGLREVVKLPGVVVSVGNIAVGGTGKTPLVIALAKSLAKRGDRPAILTRGYKSGLAKRDNMVLLNGGIHLAPRANQGSFGLPDEARMQSVELPDVPVICGADRVAAARRWLSTPGIELPTHWLLDDGFQHRRLARDLDIVLLDATTPFAGGHLLPAGRLREPPNALARAGAIIFTRAGAGHPSASTKAEVSKLAPDAQFAAARFETSTPRPLPGTGLTFDAARHAPSLLLAGIARPEPLLAELRAQGVTLADHYLVPDHAPFDAAEARRRAESAASVLTTAKDYWRDPTLFLGLDCPVFLLELTIAMEDPRAWTALLARIPRL